MWQAPNQRVRAIANAKKRERERARKKIHVLRINALMEVRPHHADAGVAPLQIPVRLVLNDLSGKSATLFAKKCLSSGHEVTLKIEEPIAIQIFGRVIWCTEYAAGSHVLSANPYSYRVGIEILLKSQEEKDAFRIFCDEVKRSLLYPLNRAA